MSGWFVCAILAIMFLCDNKTPFDRPVVPLEYGIKATSELDLVGFNMDVSMDGSSISLKSHVPSSFEPFMLIVMMNVDFILASLANSFWASIIFGKSSAIVTMPDTPAFFN